MYYYTHWLRLEMRWDSQGSPVSSAPISSPPECGGLAGCRMVGAYSMHYHLRRCRLELTNTNKAVTKSVCRRLHLSRIHSATTTTTETANSEWFRVHMYPGMMYNVYEGGMNWLRSNRSILCWPRNHPSRASIPLFEFVCYYCETSHFDHEVILFVRFILFCKCSFSFTWLLRLGYFIIIFSECGHVGFFALSRRFNGIDALRNNHIISINLKFQESYIIINLLYTTLTNVTWLYRG